MDLKTSKMMLSIAGAAMHNAWVSARTFRRDYCEAKDKASKRCAERRQDLLYQQAEAKRIGPHCNLVYIEKALNSLDGGRSDVEFWLNSRERSLQSDTASKLTQLAFCDAADAIGEAE